MKREIKFRAWVTGTNTMVDWDAIQQNDREGISTLYDYITAPDCVTMQYTGLKDKNGKEIYEGDIVAFMDGGYISTENGIDTNEFMSTGKIEWCDERKGWDVTNREDVDTDECFDEYMEVIGNIYETPELLKP